MAEGVGFKCPTCDFTIASWSDGNPYYIDENGEKQYAYHPDHDKLVRCIGNDADFICLDCAKTFRGDSRDPKSECPTCQSALVVSTWELDGKVCPKCRDGTLYKDPDVRMIS
ncbi:MAG: hypothetical protein R3C59_08040 [Planctomycetaceae bacterium]